MNCDEKRRLQLKSPNELKSINPSEYQINVNYKFDIVTNL